MPPLALNLPEEGGLPHEALEILQALESFLVAEEVTFHLFWGVCIYIYIYIIIYIYIYIYNYLFIYLFIYIYRYRSLSFLKG